MSEVGEWGPGEDHTVVEPGPGILGLHLLLFLPCCISEVVLVKVGEDTVTQIWWWLWSKLWQEQAGVQILHICRDGRTKPRKAGSPLDTDCASFLFPTQEDKRNGRQGFGLRWQTEHIQILHLLVFSLETQLKLQELTRPTGEETAAVKFWKLENRQVSGN